LRAASVSFLIYCGWSSAAAWLREFGKGYIGLSSQTPLGHKGSKGPKFSLSKKIKEKEGNIPFPVMYGFV
jgi:hypothetical protein